VPHSVSGRQHYLKFSARFTWRLWNDNGFKYDSTICYANDIGFRAGVAREYPVFDFLKRKQLDLIERPTIVMERALLQKHNNPVEFESTLLTMRDLVKKYHGQFVFLWHPDNFNVQEWNQFKGVYRKIFVL
jgi:peptidoglycan/xylan/chitin deacetylase (PgdA/CDA1 family)